VTGSPQEFAALVRLAQKVSIVGDEQIAGMATTHVTFTYDAAKAASGGGNSGPGAPTNNETVTTQARGDMWIEKGTYYIRQLKLVLPTTGTSGGQAPSSGGTYSTVVVSYSRFNEPLAVPIERPERVVTLPASTP
jgi:hypothetical protein